METKSPLEEAIDDEHTISSMGLKETIFGSNSQNLILGIIAIIILMGSSSLLVYSAITQEDTDTIEVNGNEYTWDEIFQDHKTIELGDHEGVMLSDLINDTGLEDPEGHEYKIIAADGYVKTVSWDDMMNGIIVKETKMTYFPDLPKQFYVKDVVKIEVK